MSDFQNNNYAHTHYTYVGYGDNGAINATKKGSKKKKKNLSSAKLNYRARKYPRRPYSDVIKANEYFNFVVIVAQQDGVQVSIEYR